MTFSPFLVGCMAGSVHSVSFLANEAEHTQRANRIGWFTNQMRPYIKQHGVGWWAGGPFPSISGAVWSMAPSIFALVGKMERNCSSSCSSSAFSQGRIRCCYCPKTECRVTARRFDKSVYVCMNVCMSLWTKSATTTVQSSSIIPSI